MTFKTLSKINDETPGDVLRIINTEKMVYNYQINEMALQTGDIICTMNGKPDILPGEFWRFVGRLVPGDVDHVAIYLGPDGRCAEAGALGVITFDVREGIWDAEHLLKERGHLLDSFYGVAYPLADRGLSPELEEQIRSDIAAFCLAQVGKSYNLNFLNSDTDESFYCSQLAYRAYLRCGVNLNTGMAMESLPGTNRIIYPQEIWNECIHRMILKEESQKTHCNFSKSRIWDRSQPLHFRLSIKEKAVSRAYNIGYYR